MRTAEALDRLVTGNKRFVSGQTISPHRDPARLQETAGGQAPFAVVLCCSDSRVVPEIIFDQGIGDIFTIRVAGNVLDDVVIGSIEYAAAHLKTGLVVVMGHRSCGAVNAAVGGGPAEDHTSSFTEEIRLVMKETGERDPDALAEANARSIAESLREKGPVLAPLAEKGMLSIVPAIYDIATGEVVFLAR